MLYLDFEIIKPKTMLNYTIGATKKPKKATAKKTTAEKKPRKKRTLIKNVVPESFFKSLATKKKEGKKTRYPSTPAKDKRYKVTSTCTDAGSKLKKTGSPTAAGILALCRASVKKLNITQKALKKYATTEARLSRKK